MPGTHTLLFLEPGHFHAALLLKSANTRIAPEVHLYAAPGPERDAFLALVDAFNTRADAPTRWQVAVHEARDREDAITRLVSERRGDAVVLAGRNGRKLADIARLHAAGFAVLADKPWLAAGASLDDLRGACTGSPLAMDIMPDRHELLARLRHRVVSTPEVFGELELEDPQGPTIELTSVHHLCKIVNGEPLRRPAWYYDVREQGDGLVDVQSHLTDQAQVLTGADHAFDFERDVAIDSVLLYPTAVPPDLFRDSTGLAEYPQSLAPWVRDGVLHYLCNGEIRYRLRGVSVRQVAEWGQREPVGGGDLHGAVVRGTRSVLEVRHGAHTGWVPQVWLEGRPGVDLGPALREAVAGWQDDFPGLGVEAAGGHFRFVPPPALHTTHESHFARELDRFLDYLDAGRWPQDLQPRILTRHRILHAASARAAAGAAP